VREEVLNALHVEWPGYPEHSIKIPPVSDCRTGKII